MSERLIYTSNYVDGNPSPPRCHECDTVLDEGNEHYITINCVTFEVTVNFCSYACSEDINELAADYSKSLVLTFEPKE